MGSGKNGEWTFLDIITIVSFIIGIQNLELNIDQNDMDKQTRDINETANALVSAAISEIHKHLENQDRKIEEILEYIHENH